MICKDIINRLQQDYPDQAALEWDNVGLIAGRDDKEIRHIYISLDPTDEVIQDVIDKGVDMLITHHPLLLSPIKKITNETMIGNRLIDLLRHDICYYAMHTNYDVIKMGSLAGEKLGLSHFQVLEETYDVGGIGCVGELNSEMTIQELCDVVKQVFSLEAVQVFGELGTVVKKVAICPGSGKGMTDSAIEKGAQVLITGDIGHHEGIDGVAKGICVIDASHYGLEHIFIENMETYLKNIWVDIRISKTHIAHPIRVY